MKGRDLESPLPRKKADRGSTSQSSLDEAPRQVPISVLLGPADLLLLKLDSLKAPGQNLPSDLFSADEAGLLRDLCIRLKDMSEDEDASIMVQWWMKMVRELCYDTVDHLEEVIHGAPTHQDLPVLLAHAKDARESLDFCQWSPPKATKQAGRGGAGVSQLTSFRVRSKAAVVVPRKLVKSAVVVPRKLAKSAVVAPSKLVKPDVVVPSKLVELLALEGEDKERTLKVVPLNGCAGVGKTTVARELYHEHGSKFQCQAFVTVSRNPFTRGFLTSMLSQLKAPRPPGCPDVPDLIDAIKKHLKGKRYFIVIDELWTASLWNIISRAFPRGDSCSRIIATTQIHDVALACCGYDPVYIYKMEPLDDYKSLELFFSIKVSSTTLEQELKHKQYSEQMKYVLGHIYSRLAPRLRTCLLYLSMYAQGYVMKKDELVKLWVAEGFLSTVGGQDTQETAEGYFDELVSRGMIQAVDTNYGKVLSCSVHQIVLDFIRNKSREENFIITVDYNQSTLALPDKVRRLSVQFGGVKSACILESIVTSHVRSLIFWGFFKCLPSSFMDYGLLRILILHIWADEENESLDLTGIGELFLLKYLKIECNVSVKLPEKEKIRWLQHLETLQLQVHAMIRVGFSIISPAPALQRLELSRYCCIFSRLPVWMEDLLNLCILKVAIEKLSREDMDILKNLPSLTALTLYIQTAPADRIIIKEGFKVLTYFKFMCVVPCLSFAPEVMPKVQKLSLGFNYDQWRSHTFGKAEFIYLTGLKEVTIKLGIPHANNLNTKGVESALEAAVKRHPNTTLLLTVQYVDVISYGEEIKSTTAKAREEKIHEIQEGKKKMTEYSEEQDEIQHEILVDKKEITEISEVQEEKRQEIQKDKKEITERSDEPMNKPLVDSRYASTDHVSTPLKHHTQSIDIVVMGAMGSLLPKLLELLTDKYNLEPKVKHRVMSLHKEMEGLRDTLQLVATLEQLHDPIVNRMWASHVRDLSYDVENVVDSLRVRVEDSRGGKGGFITWVMELLSKSKSKAHHVFANAIDRMIHRANYLATKGGKFRMRFDDRTAAAKQNAADQRMYPLYEYQGNKVDIDVSIITEVMEKLTRKTGDVFDQLSIVSIVGMGGLGKTTLARSIYEKMWQYDCRAFIWVSRDRDMRGVYKDILFQIGESRYMDNELAIFDENQLIDKVRGLLANKRYLIVFDDVWDVNLWEAIKVALVDDGLGSRVITTTRSLDVAQTAGGVYKLKALSAAQSKVLFKAIFPYGEEDVPNNPREALEKILSKCGGVPLAINTMARCLSIVYQNTRFELDVGCNADVWQDTRQILSSSYYDMPYHLRACLLHLHIFPEDYLIKKETLIWKWAAEGLIVEEPGMGLFETGEGYLKELINRNVVMPVEDKSCSGEVTGCRVHLLVLDMICSLSTTQGFVTVLDGSKQQRHVERRPRRLAVQKRAAEQGDHLAVMRPESLRSFNTMGCHFSTELSLPRFELLRVLAIEECTLFKGSLSHIGNLLLLRYLGLYNTPIDELPEETGDLIYLQTLDLRGTRICKLPDRVAQLRQLKCLRADERAVVPHWMGNLTSLEELRVGEVSMSGNFATELGKLTELRELEFKIERLNAKSTKALVESMGNLRKIQVLRLTMNFLPGEEANWEGFVPLWRLRDLRMKIASSRLPAWINHSLVPYLSHLSVEVKAVEEQEMENLGRLPWLISLELLTSSDIFPSISGRIDDHDAFPSLKYFSTSSPVRFLPGAMPCLESFHFKVHPPELTAADFDFASLGSLPSLQQVEVEITSEEVHEAVKRAVDEHPNRPSLHVITPDQVDTAHQRSL